MLEYKIITLDDVNDLAKMYVETFNSEPWNDRWTIDTASKRLHQMINVEDFFWILERKNDILYKFSDKIRGAINLCLSKQET